MSKAFINQEREHQVSVLYQQQLSNHHNLSEIDNHWTATVNRAHPIDVLFLDFKKTFTLSLTNYCWLTKGL